MVHYPSTTVIKRSCTMPPSQGFIPVEVTGMVVSLEEVENLNKFTD